LSIGLPATLMQYDGDNRLVKTMEAAGTAAEVDAETFYNQDGEVTGTEDGSAPASQTLYDDLGRVIQTTDPAGIVTKYGYDAEGNQTSVQVGAQPASTMQYDGEGRLIQSLRSYIA
jgi:YD repeat-containing protein